MASNKWDVYQGEKELMQDCKNMAVLPKYNQCLPYLVYTGLFGKLMTIYSAV